jgi:hypothetical protein
MNNRNHKSGRKTRGDGVLHIAVADDEEEFRRRIGVFLEKYLASKKIEYNVELFWMRRQQILTRRMKKS